MKIREINLKAFGAFSDATIDLSGSDRGLQIVYGPNEAGKSTAMRAVSTALFGFSHQSKDSSPHAKPLVGLTIESDGERLSFLRRKGRKNTLLHPETNAALPEDLLRRYLSSVDAETYARVYSIDLEELERGGEEMRQLRGLVGESLFAASLGGIGLTRLISQLDDDASKIFAPRKRKHAMRLARDDYDAALKEKKESSIPFSKWQQLQKDLRQTRQEKEATINALNELRIRERRLNRIRQSLELLTRRKQRSLELAEFGDMTPLPAEYSIQERSRIEGEIAQLKPQIESLTHELDGKDGLRGKIAEVQVDNALLALDVEIEELQERAGACQKALRDREITLHSKRNEYKLHAERILKELKIELGLDQIDHLRITPEQRVEVQNLGNEYTQVNSKPVELTAEVERLQAAIHDRRVRVSQLVDSDDLNTLEKDCRRARQLETLETDAEELQSEYDIQRTTVHSYIKSLGVWDGSIDQFFELPVPLPETVNRFVDDYAEIATSENRLIEALQQVQNESNQIRESIRTLEKTAKVLTEADLAQSRTMRDRLWNSICSIWLENQTATQDPPEEIAAQYAQQVADADEVADRLRREAGRVERLAQLLSRSESLQEQESATKKELEEHHSHRIHLQQEWVGLWRPCGIESPLPPNEMRAWLSRHAEIKALIVRSNEISGRLTKMKKSVQTAKEQLVQHALSCGQEFSQESSLMEMLEFLESHIQTEQEKRRQKQRLINEIQKLESDLAVADRQMSEAVRRQGQWMTKWRQMMTQIGCVADASASHANERMNQLGRLFEYTNQIEDIDLRMEGIDIEISEFESSVKTLSEKLNQPIGDSLFEFAVNLRQALKTQRSDKTKLESLTKQVEETEKRLAAANTKRNELTGRLSQLCEIADVDSSDQLPEIEETSRRFAECRDKLAQIEDQLIHLGGGLSIDELVKEAEGQDGDRLSAELASIASDIETKEEERDEVAAKLRALESQCNGSDTESRSSDADQRALGILSRMQDDASRFVRLRVASVVLRQMIDKHRAENEDPLLAKASDLFSQITCGQFLGLRNDYENDEAVLKGIRHNEELVAVDEMSSGTRDQMYLALRLGYLQRRISEQNTMPVMVDDILVNFDDQRAAATLKVLTELGEQTQIVLFTHHQRVADIAKADLNQDACFVHQLPARRIAV